MKRIYNFGAGPAAVPLEVLERIQSELLDWHGHGLSIAELGHRTPLFNELIDKITADFRELLNIPSNYHVLFLSGGARVQFAMIPLNILAGKTKAAYVDSGFWSRIAEKEAQKYCQTRRVASSESSGYTIIPAANTWNIQTDDAYLHYTANETIDGIEFLNVPQIPADIPLITDMTSNLLTCPVPIERFGLIYAATQKNIGISGMTIVIVRDDLIKQPAAITPIAFNYAEQVLQKSLVISPPTFTWYVIGLILEWLKKQGGLTKMAEFTLRKSQKLYNVIDSSAIYQNRIHPSCRSRVNVVFRLPDKRLEERFLREAETHNLYYLGGHKVAGGIRASLYNAVTGEAVDTLVDFMRDFERRG